jgi:SAM-dependent methyltransferase
MTATKLDVPVRFVGFDTGGEVFLSNNRVFRGIYPGKSDLYRKVLHICKTHDLFQFGIVSTRELNSNPHPELPYDLVLEHEHIPFISYPHEWPGSMLKDAAIFHINLYAELGKRGLTIKDWHPYNILFKGVVPIFVDFSSIVPMGNLQNEAYLTPPRIPPAFRHLWNTTSSYFFEMYRRMCEPYFLLPLYMMHAGQHTKAHISILETYLNVAKPKDVRSLVGRKYKLFDILNKLALIQPGSGKSWFLKLLRLEIETLSVSRRGYLDYYASKGEDFGFSPSPNWNNKQKVVYDAVKCFQPKTVLDIGSNTGWFSVLAARLGCQVVAMDIDDACVDAVYRRAKQEKLPILPLVANLANLTPDIAPPTFKNEPSLSLIGGDAPLITAANKRLKCEMVLALAIIHHLVLGSGLRFERVVELLSALTEKLLVIEFVAREDELIMADPAFFPSYNGNPQEFSWYTLENFIIQLKSVFRSVNIKPSHPDSRTIIVCEK